MSRNERIMRGAAAWAGYYRSNPSRFVKDYLHIELRLFQKIIITMMNISTVFVYIASRGQGKSFLCAIYICFRAILYPGEKIVIASGTRTQAIGVLRKITMELAPNSDELRNEIDWKATQINGTNAMIAFKNTSYVEVVTAGESARGRRANVLVIDEFRLVPKDVIDTILRHFLSSEREPKYSALTRAEKAEQKKKEPNSMMYLSSGFFKDHWSYTRCTDACRMMLSPDHAEFVCGLPWQLAVSEDLLSIKSVEEQMSESDFTEIKWAMEMGAMFWGGGDGSFFDYNTVSKNRHVQYAMLPSHLSEKLGNSQYIRIQPKRVGEVRILSADIALMSSKRHNNDATAIFINQMLPTKAGRYVSNIVYCDTVEGLHTEDQALMIRQLFDEYDCDYIVLDCQGVGLGVYDTLARDISDPITGELYPALSCCNDPVMAERCISPNADKVIWSVKASSAFNSNCAVLLREGFKSGRIRLLVTEYDAETLLSEIKGYDSLTQAEQLQLRMPYVHTTLLIDELVKLQHDESGGKVKVFEKSGMRKDRYSSLAYNYYVATMLDAKLGRKTRNVATTESFVIKAPKYNNSGKAVNGIYGRRGNHSWR